MFKDSQSVSQWENRNASVNIDEEISFQHLSCETVFDVSKSVMTPDNITYWSQLTHNDDNDDTQQESINTGNLTHDSQSQVVAMASNTVTTNIMLKEVARKEVGHRSEDTTSDHVLMIMDQKEPSEANVTLKQEISRLSDDVQQQKEGSLERLLLELHLDMKKDSLRLLN